MKLKLLLFSNQNTGKVHKVLKYTPGNGGFLTLRMGMLDVLIWGLKFGVGKIVQNLGKVRLLGVQYFCISISL